MIINVASFETSVAKTMFAIHLASHLQKEAPTSLIDCSYDNFARTLLKGVRLPFKVPSKSEALLTRDFTHAVFDNGPSFRESDLKELINSCDLLIVLTTPDTLSLEALAMMLLTVDESSGTEPPNEVPRRDRRLAKLSDTDQFRATAYSKGERLGQTPPMEFGKLVERVIADWIQNKR
jgi:cellulose biosynthesis protein BcsQ